MFFLDPEGYPFVFYGNDLYAMLGGGAARAAYLGMMYQMTGLVPSYPGAKVYFETLAAIATSRSPTREIPTWVSTDVEGLSLFVNLCTDDREIIRVTPNGATVVPNGTNEDGVILRTAPKVRPIRLTMSDVDHRNLEPVLDDLFLRHLATSPTCRRVIGLWSCLWPMIEFSGTRPMLRLEGDAGSGKTWAAKMITTFLYGATEQKKGQRRRQTTPTRP